MWTGQQTVVMAIHALTLRKTSMQPCEPCSHGQACLVQNLACKLLMM